MEEFNEDLHEQAKEIDPYLLNTLGLNARPKGTLHSPLNSMYQEQDIQLDQTMKGVIPNFFDQANMDDNKHRSSVQ